MCLQIDPISQDTYNFTYTFKIIKPCFIFRSSGIITKFLLKVLFVCKCCFIILTRLKVSRGEVKLVEPSYQLSIRRTSQSPQVAREHSPSMAHEESHEGPNSDEEDFRKDFYDMAGMVRILFEERNANLQGERSKTPKGNEGKDEKTPK